MADDQNDDELDEDVPEEETETSDDRPDVVWSPKRSPLMKIVAIIILGVLIVCIVGVAIVLIAANPSAPATRP